MSQSLSDINRYLIGRSVSSAYFWGAISIPYLVYRGFSIAEAFSLIGLYSLLIVILEFPTGVIGDLYGHKLSIIISNLTGALVMFILAQDLPHYGYYLLIILAAISSSMLSGSDDALLKSISPNFSKSLATIRALEMLVASISIAAGGFIAKYSMPLPIFLTGVFWLLSLFFIFPIHNPHKLIKGANLFSASFVSLGVIFSSFSLLGLILYAGINGGFAMSIKTLINSFSPALGLDLGLIGLFVGLGMLMRAVFYQFSYLFAPVRNRNLFLLVLLNLIFLGLVPPGYLSLLLLCLVNGLTAVIGIRADLAINNLVADQIRASVLSFKNLFIRLFSSGYLFISGIAIESSYFRLLMLFTLIIYMLAGFGFVKLSRHGQQKTNTVKPAFGRH